jgi:GMP synthase (glutamine-hydrolysing)
MQSILLVKCGDAANHIRLKVGDYDSWFAWALAGVRVNVNVVRPYLRESLPSAKPYDAVLVTGSSSSVREQLPWMKQTTTWLRDTAEAGKPILGVCFGHQLLGEAYGSKVVLNPNGRETGSIDLELTAEGRADPLFAGAPPQLTVQATHEDIVDRAPAGTRVLAGNGNTALQAVAFAKKVRGVQFHPELSAEGMRALIESRIEKLEAEAVARGVPKGHQVPRLLAGIRPTPFGPQLLRNFLEAFT